MTLTELWLTPDGFKHWKTVKPFQQTVDGKTYRVPKGFRTDLASVPRFLWAFIPPFGNVSKGAVVHDYLCIYDAYDGKMTQKEADQVFYKLLVRHGVYKWKAKLMYFAVRIAQRLTK